MNRLSLKEPPILHGLRRDLTKTLFEELVALQCTKNELTGYTGIPEDKLEKWCRRVYRRPLAEMMEMIRQDGLVEIRRCSFEQLKKSATIVSQQYNRFLSVPADNGKAAAAEEAIRKFVALSTVPGDAVSRLFAPAEPLSGEPPGDG